MLHVVARAVSLVLLDRPNHPSVFLCCWRNLKLPAFLASPIFDGFCHCNNGASRDQGLDTQQFRYYLLYLLYLHTIDMPDTRCAARSRDCSLLAPVQLIIFPPFFEALCKDLGHTLDVIAYEGHRRVRTELASRFRTLSGERPRHFARSFIC